MSHRAIQRLRQEREAQLDPDANSNDESEEEDEGEFTAPVKKTAFAAMMDDDSSSEEDDESSSSSDEEDQGAKAAEETSPSHPSGAKPKSEDNKEPVEEDLDDITEEFKAQDMDPDGGEDSDGGGDNYAPSFYGVITSNMDVRDLDVDYVMRTSLLGGTAGSDPASSRGSANRRGRKNFLFGPPRDNWVRPPTIVAGGMGMTTYDAEPRALPWPYSDMKEGDSNPGPERWFCFKYSDSFERDCQDYQRIKATGDPNALAMFIADNPYVTEALLQLSTVLYQTNQSQEGLALLRRSLWIYECAALSSFTKMDGKTCLMDCGQRENLFFFLSMFRLVRSSYAQGLVRASLAISRFMLSLDPLRDPMGVLLSMDHFAIQSNSEDAFDWIIDMVESDKIQLYFKDENNEYQCDLLSLPNWAYSYAMGLRRKHLESPTEDSEEKANEALHSALQKFPNIVELLLHANEVNLTARSFQTDWPVVMEFLRARSQHLVDAWSQSDVSDPVVRACTSQAYDLVCRIFVKMNHKIWSGDDVKRWLYEAVLSQQNSPEKPPVPHLQPALMRYARCDPEDYEDKFQTMPADANPLDPALVMHALNLDPNRRRLMQRMPRGQGGVDEIDIAAQQFGVALGGPPTGHVDPDWPLLEVFWRSALPWNHTDGVPPPRR